MICALGERRPQSLALFIADAAMVIGAVELGEDSSVWFGAVLRGDNEPIVVGARSNIQDGAVVHTDMGFPAAIGEDVTVGHRAILHGCTVESRCTIGMGAILMNGSRIGANSLVAAGALVPEGREFPPGSLIMGAPARQTRLLSGPERAEVARGADIYVCNARRFRDLMRPA